MQEILLEFDTSPGPNFHKIILAWSVVAFLISFNIHWDRILQLLIFLIFHPFQQLSMFSTRIVKSECYAYFSVGLQQAATVPSAQL